MKILTMIILMVISISSFANEYTLAAAPRGSRNQEEAIYKPIANYLSRETGDKFTYVYIEDWMTYRKAIANGKYDIFFSGSHFSSFLSEFKEYSYLVRFNEGLIFVVVTKQENKLGDIRKLAGKQVCVHPEPNLGTLMFLSLFENPVRQPGQKIIKGWKMAYDGVIRGDCEAAVLPYEVFDNLNTEKKAAVRHQFDIVQNNTFMGSKRIPPDKLEIIKQALLKSDNQNMKRLLDTYSYRTMHVANKNEYFEGFKVLKSDYILGAEMSKNSPAVAEK